MDDSSRGSPRRHTTHRPGEEFRNPGIRQALRDRHTFRVELLAPHGVWHLRVSRPFLRKAGALPCWPPVR